MAAGWVFFKELAHLNLNEAVALKKSGVYWVR